MSVRVGVISKAARCQQSMRVQSRSNSDMHDNKWKSDDNGNNNIN